MPPAALDHLRQVLADPQPFAGGAEVAVHTALGSQADRIRLELTALARVHQSLIRAGESDAARAVDRVAEGSARALDAIAAALREGRTPLGWEGEREGIEGALGSLRSRLAEERPGSPTPSRAVLEQAARRGEALAGQLRAAVRLAAVPAGGDPAALEEAALTGRALPANATRSRLIDPGLIGERLATLRANLDLSSEACRHGLRLAVTLAVGVAMARLVGLPHGYWLPLTAMIVLRPDFAGTFTRGLSRLAGTLLGAGIVTLAIAELRPGQAALTALVLFWCFGAYSILLANYAAFSVCIASLVVTLLAFTGQPELAVAGDRTVYTAIGAGLALLAYAVWPTWAGTYLPERLAGLLATEGRYGHAVLEAWSDPGRADRLALQRARLAARLARSNAETAAERWTSEPAGAPGLRRDTVFAVLAEVRAYVQGVLSLHAQLPSDGPSRPELMPLADDVAEAMSSVAATLTTGQPAPCWPQLRAEQLRLTETLGDQDLAVVSETDLIVNAVNTLGHLVGAGQALNPDS
jgi:uncharacterized membrane protein YccC